MVQTQPGKILCETLSRKYPTQKRAGRVAQGVGPEFKPQYCKKKKNLYSFLYREPLNQFTLTYFLYLLSLVYDLPLT
jgi:hypothetical protein